MMEADDDLLKFAADGAAPLPFTETKGWIEHDSARIWYGSYGSGEPVVLLHGLFDNSEDWGYQVAALTAAAYRVIVIDSRGRGRSSCGTQPFTHERLAAEVVAVMDKLGLASAFVVGWSDGATVALTVALRHPTRLRGVFAFAGNMDPSGLLPFMPTPILERVFNRAKKDYARLSATPDGFEALTRTVNKMMETEPDYSRADLAGIRTHVAVVLGEKDEFIKREHAEYLARTIPGATLTILPGVSHFAMLQRPGLFNDAVLAFLRTR